jgi:TonB family protein
MNACRLNFRLISGISICFAFLVQFISSPRLRAAESPPTFFGNSPKRSYTEAFLNDFSGTSAVDTNGARRRGLDYPGKHPPWQHDMIKAVAPNYPDRDRILRHKGEGLFQLMLDPKTGSVTKVTVIKSTGFPTLDASAVTSLYQWRWKPGKWREVDIPVRFTTILSGYHGSQAGVVQLPPARRQLSPRKG